MSKFKIIEPTNVEEGKVGKYKRAGHLTDQILKYNYPKGNSNQLSIFDSLRDTTRRTIETVGETVKEELVEGIKLSPSQTKVIDCLCKLLHQKSQNLEPEQKDYYSGNKGYELVNFSGMSNALAPNLAFTLYELTKEYKGEEKKISGKDMYLVSQILVELNNKRFLLSYVETTKTKDGGRIERKIEDFQKLINIPSISETIFSKDNIQLSKKEDVLISMNPIFRRQIDSKFILYPNDINKRTIIAYGSHNVSDIAFRLRDYLLKELSLKHYKPEIMLERLYYLVADRWMRESRKKKVKEYLEKALEMVATLGILESFKIVPSKITGESKMMFTLNKHWE